MIASFADFEEDRSKPFRDRLYARTSSFYRNTSFREVCDIIDFLYME